MNGAHDLGGMHGFGPVPKPEDGKPFPSEAARRMFAVGQATGALGLWNIDIARGISEDIPPGVYLNSLYHEVSLRRVERLAVGHGLISAEEVEAGKALTEFPAKAVTPLRPENLEDFYTRKYSYERPAPAVAKFAPGDTVRFRLSNPRGHTRLPRYARGHQGVVERIHGSFIFPDSRSKGQGEDPQWLYAVRISLGDLTKDGVGPKDALILDAWEPYLELLHGQPKIDER